MQAPLGELLRKQRPERPEANVEHDFGPLDAPAGQLGEQAFAEVKSRSGRRDRAGCACEGGLIAIRVRCQRRVAADVRGERGLTRRVGVDIRVEGEHTDSRCIDRDEFGIQPGGAQLVLVAHAKTTAVPEQRAVATRTVRRPQQQGFRDAPAELVAAQSRGEHAARIDDQQIALAQQVGQSANRAVSDGSAAALQCHEPTAIAFDRRVLRDPLRRQRKIEVG